MNPILESFKNSIERLKEVLVEAPDQIKRDSAIKRFELCYDLAWKSLKLYAKKEGLECNSPRACFKVAFQLKLIEDNKMWFEMIDDRNSSVHIYNEQSADKIYSHLQNYLPLLGGICERLEKANF